MNQGKKKVKSPYFTLVARESHKINQSEADGALILPPPLPFSISALFYWCLAPELKATWKGKKWKQRSEATPGNRTWQLPHRRLCSSHLCQFFLPQIFPLLTPHSPYTQKTWNLKVNFLIEPNHRCLKTAICFPRIDNVVICGRCSLMCSTFIFFFQDKKLLNFRTKTLSPVSSFTQQIQHYFCLGLSNLPSYVGIQELEM